MRGTNGKNYYMFKDFFSCIREGRKPFFDEYASTTMASVGILSHRSLLSYGEPYDIPDFHREEDRKKYENDTLTPFILDGKAPTISCCSRPDYRPSDETVRNFLKTLSEK